MRKRFLAFIKKHALFHPKDRILLALSGGVDSMVMTDLCLSWTGSVSRFGVAHCNFDLRGEESTEDERFVREFAHKRGICFYSRVFDTEHYARTHGVSIQMAARTLRYQWFEALAREHGFQKIAIAQHLNDSVETVIHNLIRGTSIAGLRGIRPLQGRLVRPLLAFSKEEIEAYAKDHKVAWREDRSNQEKYYKRNFIRHEVLPLFEKLNPGYLHTFEATLNRNLEVEGVFNAVVGQWKKELLKEEEGDVRLAKEELRKKKIGPYILSLLIEPYGFNYPQAQDIWDQLEGLPGRIFPAKDHQLLIDRDHLIISKATVTEEGPQLLHTGERSITIGGVDYEVDVRSADELGIDKSHKNALLDLDTLKFPLEIRNWQQGDAFVPLGMKGKKKLSDFMIDRKIPLNLKKQVKVMVSDGRIVWVVGWRIDDRHKVTGLTRRIFRLKEKTTHV